MTQQVRLHASHFRVREKTRPDQSTRGLRFISHRYRLSVTGRALADHARIHAITRRVMHYADCPPPVNLDSDRDRMRGIPMDEVCRPVQRVKNPANAGVAAEVRALFADDLIMRAAGLNNPDKLTLGFAVNLGHEVGCRPLRIDLELARLHGAAMNVGRATRRTLRGFE
jgi:hypothetical protein